MGWLTRSKTPREDAACSLQLCQPHTALGSNLGPRRVNYTSLCYCWTLSGHASAAAIFFPRGKHVLRISMRPKSRRNAHARSLGTCMKSKWASHTQTNKRARVVRTHVCWCASLCEHRGQEGFRCPLLLSFLSDRISLEFPSQATAPKIQPPALRSRAPPSLL